MQLHCLMTKCVQTLISLPLTTAPYNSYHRGNKKHYKFLVFCLLLLYLPYPHCLLQRYGCKTVNVDAWQMQMFIASQVQGGYRCSAHVDVDADTSYFCIVKHEYCSIKNCIYEKYELQFGTFLIILIHCMYIHLYNFHLDICT